MAKDSDEVPDKKPARDPWYKWLGPWIDAATRIALEVIRK